MWQALCEFGDRVSDKGAALAGHPVIQFLLLLACVGWIASGLTVNLLTLVLSVLAITLTQMVLNQQKRHETALHIKIDELVGAMSGARDEVAGIENKTEAELQAIRKSGKHAEAEIEEREGHSRAA